MSLNVPVTVYHDKVEQLADIPDLQRTLVRRLSIFVTNLDGRVRPLLQGTRSDSGIVVVAQAAGLSTANTGLEAGDIIRAIGRTPLESTSQLQEMVRKLRPGDAVALQVERGGKLQYLSFEME